MAFWTLALPKAELRTDCFGRDTVCAVWTRVASRCGLMRPSRNAQMRVMHEPYDCDHHTKGMQRTRNRPVRVDVIERRQEQAG